SLVAARSAIDPKMPGRHQKTCFSLCYTNPESTPDAPLSERFPLRINPGSADNPLSPDPAWPPTLNRQPRGFLPDCVQNRLSARIARCRSAALVIQRLALHSLKPR